MDKNIERNLEKIHLKALKHCRNRMIEAMVPEEIGPAILFSLTDAIDRVSSQISREGACRLDYLKALEIALRTLHEESSEQRKLIEASHKSHDGNGGPWAN